MIQSRAEQSRVTYVDVFRGLGILLMVMGHIGFGGAFDKFIHAFHMPMFFFVSGYFYRKKDIGFRDYFAKKKQSLLLTYVLTGVICYGVWLILQMHHQNKGVIYFLKPVYHLLWTNTDGLPIAGALWFLTALFFCNVLYFALDRWITDMRILTGVILVITLAGNLLPLLLPHRLPWAMDAAFVGMGLYHAARLLHSCEKKNAFRVNSLFDMNIVQIFVAGLIITALIFANGAINLRAGTYAFIPLFWINAIGASLIGWSIARKIDSCEKGILSMPARWLRRVGKDSLVYLCWNQLAILIVAKIMIHIVGDSVSVPVLHTMILILTMLFLWEMDSLLQNTRLRILLGK